MLGELYNTFLFQPIYNGLVFLIDILPGADVGLAIIILTLVVKFILFPLSMRSVKTQIQMKKIQPEVDEIRKKHKEDKQTQAAELMKLYKEHKVKPFSGFLLLLIQVPILIALYSVFLRGGLPDIDPALLYTFVDMPEQARMMFLGLVNVASKSIPLALLTGISQYFQVRLTIPKSKNNPGSSTAEQVMQNMQKQMKFVFPVMMTVIGYVFSAAVALYLITSNIFHILQELYVRKRFKKGEHHHGSEKDTNNPQDTS